MLYKRYWFINLIKEDYPLLIAIFILILIISILGMATAIFSQKLIDDILPSKDIQKLVLGLSTLLVLLLGRGLMAYVAGFLGLKQGKDFNNRLMDKFYGSLLFLPKSFFDNRRIGELVARMNDTSRIQSTIAAIVGDLLKNAFLFITGEVILFIYSWQIGLISLVAIPIYALISWRYHKGIVNAQHQVMAANAHKSSNYISTMQGIETVKANVKEDKFAALNRTIYGFFQDKIFSLGKLGISLNLVAEVAGVIILIALLSICCYFVFCDKMTVGELMAVISISGTLFPAIVSLAFANITLQGARVAFDRMFEFTTMQPEVLPTSDASKSSDKLTDRIIPFHSLEAQHIAFRFKGKIKLLEDVSFTIKKGKITALLGESGKGKTTLLNMLQKFYTYESGNILLDGDDFSEIAVPTWRSNIGVVPGNRPV